ncbi:MAG: GAF domain-containing protein, partial [Bacteroidota bacterium]
AYNLRYEIIKKRIDKAFLLESEERLTQAGKIAIVYATDKDREEYMDYLDFLKLEGYIEDEIEEVELERLQETQGLRALRVTVK